nr:RecName: Full=Large ribosomal subunit protein P1; AltName: Full=50S ribosomal protein L12 [Populus euphratica]
LGAEISSLTLEEAR